MLDEVKQAIPYMEAYLGYSHEDTLQAAERVSHLLERFIDYGKSFASKGQKPPDTDFFLRLARRMDGKAIEDFAELFQKYFQKGYKAQMNQQEETPHE